MKKNINLTIKIQVIIIIFLFFVFLFKFNQFPPQIPLYYSKPEGEEQITDSFMIFILPTLSLIALIFNSYIFKKWFNYNFFIGSIIYWANIFISFLTSFIFLNILFLIT